MAEASAKAVKAGTDLTCGNEYLTLVEAVQKGYIKEAEIDESLKRLFVARFRLGMFTRRRWFRFQTWASIK